MSSTLMASAPTRPIAATAAPTTAVRRVRNPPCLRAHLRNTHGCTGNRFSFFGVFLLILGRFLGCGAYGRGHKLVGKKKIPSGNNRKQAPQRKRTNDTMESSRSGGCCRVTGRGTKPTHSGGRTTTESLSKCTWGATKTDRGNAPNCRWIDYLNGVVRRSEDESTKTVQRLNSRKGKTWASAV